MIFTERLTLVPFELNDAKLFLEISNDSLTTKYLRKKDHTLKSCQELLERLKLKYGDDMIFNMHRVQVSSNGEDIGFVTLYRAKDSEKAEIGYNYLSKYWGHGYAFEACDKLIELAFSESDINEIFAETHPENCSSLKLLNRLDFDEMSESGPDQGKMLVRYKK